MNIINNTAVIASVALLLAVTGCTKESAFETQADVAKAGAAGAQDVAEARVEAAGEMADGRMEMTDTQNDVARQAADSALTVSKTGAARTQCKDQADVDLAVANERAEAAKLAAYPNG